MAESWRVGVVGVIEIIGIIRSFLIINFQPTSFTIIFFRVGERSVSKRDYKRDPITPFS